MPISLKTFKNVINSRLLFGHYHNSQYLNSLMRLYCIAFIFNLVVMYFLLFSEPLNFGKYYTFPMVEVITHTLVSVIFQGRYVKKMYILVEKSQKILNITKISISYLVYVCLVVIFTLRFYFLLNFSTYPVTDIRFWTCVIALTSYFINHMTKVVVFDIIYQTMKQIRNNLQFRYVFINVIGRERVNYRIQNIKNNLCMYKHLASFMVDIDYELQAWVIFFS